MTVEKYMEAPATATDTAIDDGTSSHSPMSDRSSSRIIRYRVGWRTWLGLGITLFVALGLLRFVGSLIGPLAILFLAVSLAAALEPAVAWIAQWTPRVVSVIIVYAVIFLIFVGLGVLVTPSLLSQVEELRAALPESWSALENQLEQAGFAQFLPSAGDIVTSVGSLGSSLIRVPMTVFDLGTNLVLVVFLSLYALIAGPAAGRFFFSLVPESHRDKTEDTVTNMLEGMGGYIRGVLITAVVIGILAYVGLTIIGAPYPIVLAVIAGLLEVVPVLGTTISTILLTLIGFTASTTVGLLTFAYMAGVQLIEGNVLFPNIIGRQTHTSPLLSMFAFFAGLSIGGIIGALIGVPLAIAIRVLLLEVIIPQLRNRTKVVSENPQPS